MNHILDELVLKYDWPSKDLHPGIDCVDKIIRLSGLIDLSYVPRTLELQHKKK